MSSPSGDYKEGIQEIFEDLCDERHQKEAHELPDDVQMAVYRDAERLYFDRLADWADYHSGSTR
jgi:hypothetical protein